MHSTLIASLFLAVGCAMGAMSATMQPIDPIGTMRWQRRVVIVFSSNATREQSELQRAWLAKESADVADRNLAIVEVFGDAMTIDDTPVPVEPAAIARIRERFQGRPETFEVVLVGLDGEEKLRRDEPVGPALLFETIDAMPMRRAETTIR